MKITKKRVSESVLFNQRRKVRYEYLNSLGTMHGGDIYKIMDELAATVAEGHSGKACVTRWDEGCFIRPVLPADLLVFHAYINRSWKTSMDIGIQVHKVRFDENRRESLELIGIRNYVFVAVDRDGKTLRVSAVVPKTKEERTRFRMAQQRRRLRKQLAKLGDPPINPSTYSTMEFVLKHKKVVQKHPAFSK